MASRLGIGFGATGGVAEAVRNSDSSGAISHSGTNPFIQEVYRADPEAVVAKLRELAGTGVVSS